MDLDPLKYKDARPAARWFQRREQRAGQLDKTTASLDAEGRPRVPAEMRLLPVSFVITSHSSQQDNRSSIYLDKLMWGELKTRLREICKPHLKTMSQAY